MLKRIIKKLASGISLGRYSIKLILSKENKAETDIYGLQNDICLNDIVYYKKKFPILTEFEIPNCAEEATLIVNAYQKLIPLYCDDAKEPYIRSVLSELGKSSKNLEVKEACEVRIALSLAKIGWVLHPLVEKYKNHRKIVEVFLKEKELLTNMRQDFGMPLDRWLYKRSRGASLSLYFESHMELIEGKKVLHIAPEPALRRWFNKLQSEGLSVCYSTLDAGMQSVDFRADIRKLNFENGSYDLIICHHVLEHVIDDTAAFSELFRILNNGGVLNFTVPCSLHHNTSHEWFIPDGTLTNHVRHYGMNDLIRRIERSGFTVSIDDWLIKMDEEVLQKRESYPFPIYHCIKDTT